MWGFQNWVGSTAQKIKYSIKDFFGKSDQIRRFGHIYSINENLIFFGSAAPWE